MCRWNMNTGPAEIGNFWRLRTTGDRRLQPRRGLGNLIITADEQKIAAETLIVLQKIGQSIADKKIAL